MDGSTLQLQLETVCQKGLNFVRACWKPQRQAHTSHLKWEIHEVEGVVTVCHVVLGPQLGQKEQL